jgi:hypothetical protein
MEGIIDDSQFKEITQHENSEKNTTIKCFTLNGVDKMINRIMEFRAICDKMADTYTRKNADYGNSFTMTRNKYNNAILIRLNDKLSRLESVMTSGKIQVLDESINDTLLDLAVYAIMELVERKQDDEYKGIINKEFPIPGSITEIKNNK